MSEKVDLNQNSAEEKDDWADMMTALTLVIAACFGFGFELCFGTGAGLIAAGVWGVIIFVLGIVNRWITN